MSSKVCVIVGAALLAGCAAREVRSVDELRTREASAMEVAEIVAADGSFALRAPARLAESIEKDDVADTIRLRFDEENPSVIECLVYHAEVEMASTLRFLAEDVFEALGERYDGALGREVRSVSAGAIGGNPYLGIDWRYSVARDGSNVFGEVRQIVSNVEGR